MTNHDREQQFSQPSGLRDRYTDQGMRKVAERLTLAMARDELVQSTVHSLRAKLQSDRVVLYYFYSKWEGQVTFEALGPHATSIVGSKGPDQCFNEEYAAMYEAGRIRAIPDIELEPIQECHRDLLRQLMVRANLVVPVINTRGLWGLLVAHHCRSARPWSLSDIDNMRQGAEALALAPSIRNS
jgi:GAF domain-containing protein